MNFIFIVCFLYNLQQAYATSMMLNGKIMAPQFTKSQPYVSHNTDIPNGHNNMALGTWQPTHGIPLSLSNVPEDVMNLAAQMQNTLINTGENDKRPFHYESYLPVTNEKENLLNKGPQSFSNQETKPQHGKYTRQNQEEAYRNSALNHTAMPYKIPLLMNQFSLGMPVYSPSVESNLRNYRAGISNSGLLHHVGIPRYSSRLQSQPYANNVVKPVYEYQHQLPSKQYG